jgi:hypothetical protein
MTLAQQIDDALKNNPDGWCASEKAHNLAACVVAVGGGTVVELGIYAGRSLFPMALAVKHLGAGHVIGVDAFDCDVAADGENDANAEWWERVPFEKIEEKFREALAELDLQSVVTVLKEKSENVIPPHEISVLHVDGQHMDQAVADVRRFAPQVMIGGFCILDDLTWEGGRVERAAQELLAHGFVERRRVLGEEEGSRYKNDYAVFQRTHHC